MNYKDTRVAAVHKLKMRPRNAWRLDKTLLTSFGLYQTMCYGTDFEITYNQLL